LAVDRYDHSLKDLSTNGMKVIERLKKWGKGVELQILVKSIMYLLVDVTIDSGEVIRLK
jgi:hypothetical protein